MLMEIILTGINILAFILIVICFFVFYNKLKNIIILNRHKLVRNLELETNKVFKEIENSKNGLLNERYGFSEEVKLQKLFGEIQHSVELSNRIIQDNISTYNIHQKTFCHFKNINQGKDVVIVATGPTLQQFNPFDKEAIYIGVNSAFLYEKIKLNYLFMQDYFAVKKYILNSINYFPEYCIKFFGLTTEFDKSINRVIPESIAIKARALRYRTDWADIPYFTPRFAYDISSQPLGCFGSIVFPAIQFALWTNPKRIYLVGCDCSSAGHFNDKMPCYDLAELIGPWKQLKEFKNIYYPQIEIISINPVGLQGIFKDVFC